MRPGPPLRMARHLRPSQVGWRLWYRLRRPLFSSTLWDWLVLDARPVAELALIAPPPLVPGDPAHGAAIAAGRFRLLGREHPVGDWAAAEQSHLWRFTLHYFEWLADLAATGDAATARALVASWMDGHAHADSLAWHPYPLSLRLSAWLGHAAFLLDGADQAFKDRFLAGLGRQAAHLAHVTERDVGGNHLIKNLKALVTASLCLEGRQDRLGLWLRALRRTLVRQILPDGAHYERSPAYHVQVLTDLVELAAVLAAAGHRVSWLDDIIAVMGAAFRFYRHGDGGLALFNDGSVGEAAALDALDKALPATAIPPALPQAGYWRLRAGEALALFDAGPVCPDDLPAHAHADTLSFELSLGAERVIVNCGTYAYQDSLWRNRLRGTASHSTVLVDGQDSAELFGAFRVGRRPRQVTGFGSGAVAEGSHDGYRHLGVVHHRTLALDEAALTGEDRLAGTCRPAQARFHLHPHIAAEAVSDGVVLTTASGRRLLFAVQGGTLGIEDGVYAPRFGEMSPSRCLVVEMAGTVLSWRLAFGYTGSI